MGWELYCRHMGVVVSESLDMEGLGARAKVRRSLAGMDSCAAEEDNHLAVEEARSRLGAVAEVLRSLVVGGMERRRPEERSLAEEGIAGSRMVPAEDALAGLLRKNLYLPSSIW